MKQHKNKKVLAIVLGSIGIVVFSIIASVLFLKESTCTHTFPEKDGDYVVLVHGLGSNFLTFEKMGHFLSEKGYTVINVQYPSNRYDIPTLSKTIVEHTIEKHCTDRKKKINFVTHSMGGLLVRTYLNNTRDLSRFGKCIMIAPPNNGSEIADVVSKNRILSSITGPACNQLCTGDTAFAPKLGSARISTGVIAGDRAPLPESLTVLKGPNDGMVALNRTGLQGMKDFAVIHSTHFFITFRDTTIQQVYHFLNYESFIQTVYNYEK